MQTLLKEKKHILVKHEFEDGFLGIFDKQLYKIFEEMLSLDEFSNEIRTINELMAPILKKILNYQVIIREAEHKDKGKISLYCAPKKNWDILFN